MKNKLLATTILLSSSLILIGCLKEPPKKKIYRHELNPKVTEISLGEVNCMKLTFLIDNDALVAEIVCE